MAKRQYIVLLADDVCLELEIEKTFFQRGGFNVITASDGAAALALAVARRPDLVILDQVMPLMSGTDVCRALKSREETRNIPVVIISSSNRLDLEELCRSAGAVAFVNKSQGREVLLRTAAQILQVAERRQTRITVFFKVQMVVGAKESLGRGVDLSESGLRLETNQRFEPNTKFQLRFMLPGERQENNASARALRIVEHSDRNYFLSVEFTDMSAVDRRRLNQFLDHTLSPRAIR